MPIDFLPPESELVFSASRGSGPGGQNVNKVNSKVTLHWSLRNSRSLDEFEKKRLYSKLASKLNWAGELVISSGRFRDQARNKADCIDKLKQLLKKAFFEPKKRVSTKPPRASKERRVVDKKHRGKIKQARRIRCHD